MIILDVFSDFSSIESEFCIEEKIGRKLALVSISYIYILIALALDESIILDVPQFPMQNIYQSCDLGRAIGRRNVNASQ